MTPTEQNKELREAIALRLQHAYYNRHTDGIAGVYSHAPSILENYTDEIMQLITADRKRVALESRLDELEIHQSHDRGLAGSIHMGRKDVDDRIAQLNRGDNDE